MITIKLSKMTKLRDQTNDYARSVLGEPDKISKETGEYIYDKQKYKDWVNTLLNTSNAAGVVGTTSKIFKSLAEQHNIEYVGKRYYHGTYIDLWSNKDAEFLAQIYLPTKLDIELKLNKMADEISNLIATTELTSFVYLNHKFIPSIKIFVEGASNIRIPYVVISCNMKCNGCMMEHYIPYYKISYKSKNLKNYVNKFDNYKNIMIEHFFYYDSVSCEERVIRNILE